MSTHHLRAIIPLLSTSLAILLSCNETALGNHELYFAEYSASDSIDWDEKIPVFHYWKHEEGETSDGTIYTWEGACEDAFRPEPTERRYVHGYYRSMNQFVTVNDLIELWYKENKERGNDAFTFWRMNQYQNLVCRHCDDSESARLIKNAVENLLDYEAETQWDLNYQASLRNDLKEFYERRLLKLCLYGPDDLSDALRQEEEAWQDYNKKLSTAYNLLESSPDGLEGSSWPTSMAGITEDNLDMRIASLEDYLRLNENSFRFPEEDGTVGIGMVIHESDDFISELREDENHQPLSARKKALDEEVAAWIHWMNARTKVSLLLGDSKRDGYESVTGSIIRRKFIMLKNRYQGYGVTSQDVLNCLIPYDTDSEGLYGPSFSEKWRSLYGDVLF